MHNADQSPATVESELHAAKHAIAALEAELKEAKASSEQFRSIVDDQTELICRYDDQFVLTFVNPAYAVRYGLHPEQMIGNPFLNHIPLEDRDHAVAHVRSLGVNRPVGVSTHRSILPDGRIQWHEWTDRARLDSTGRIIEYLAVGRDVTERKQQELFKVRLTEVLEAIAEDQPLLVVLEKLVLAVETHESASKASIQLLEEKTGKLSFGAAPSLPPGYRHVFDGIAIGPMAGTCGTAAYRRQMIISEDISTDPLWQPQHRSAALENNLRSCWSQPLLDRQGDVMGTFAIFHAQVHAPAAAEIELARMAAHIAEIAIRREKEQAALREAYNALENRVQDRTAELEGIKNRVEEERNLLRTLIDAVPAFIYVKDTQHRILVSNAAHTRSLRALNPAYTPGMTDTEVFPPVLALRFLQDDEQVLKTGEPIVQREEQSIGEHGETIWALTTKTPLRNLKGDITGLVGYTQDVTVLKANEVALQEKHEAELQMQADFRALHEMSIELTGIDSMDVFYRTAIELGLSRLGISRLGLLRYDPLASKVLGTYGTDDQGRLRSEDHICQNLSELEPLRLAKESPDRLHVSESTALFHDMKQVGSGWNVVVALQHGGQILGWLCADNLLSQKPLSQITVEVLAQYAMFLASSVARKEAEQKLAALSQRLELATQAGEIGIWDWDVVNDVLTWDDRMYALFGVSRDESPKSSALWLRALHPEDSQVAQTELARALRGEKTFSTEFRIVRSDGAVRHIKGDAIVLWDTKGAAVRMIGTNQDITDSRKALEREKELGNLKSRFVSMASHEFRTPLATILSTTDLLVRYRARMTTDQIEEKLNTTREQALRMRDMMEDMLQLTRMQSGRIEFKPGPQDLDALCQAIIANFETLPGNTQRIVYKAVSAPLIAHVDVQLMRQAISNLVSNGLKYSPEDMPVRIHLYPHADSIYLTIADEGIGIAEDDIKHLFVPFHRGLNVENIPGTGLGLSIANQAVEAHGGTITVESSLGEGTTFVVTIPRDGASDAAARQAIEDATFDLSETGMMRPSF